MNRQFRMLKPVTGEKLVTDGTGADSVDAVPGQIPFYQFDEEDLESFDPKLSDNSTAEDYLKSVILEARQQPDIVRASLPKANKERNATGELTFKQLSASSFISKSNFNERYEVDDKYLPRSGIENVV